MTAAKFIKYILEFLDIEAEIKKKVDDKGVLFDITCDKAGQLIGKEGQTIGAIRRILHVYGSKNKKFISIRVNPIEVKNGKN